MLHVSSMMSPNDESRSEIAFFDLETTVPTRPGQGFAILEFGAILVCPRKLAELHSYSTLVRPANISLINSLSVRCNGITPDAVSSAPTFSEIADTVFDILNGRIWAGHNILRFDCVRIREAFAELGRAAPEPKGTIDSLALLTQRFGRRAGDMKMASLAAYFGLGEQTHRSLDDVRMNLEIVKNCAAVLFLESSLPEIFTEKSWVSPNAVTRSRSSGKASPVGSTAEKVTPISGQNPELDTLSIPITQKLEEKHPILSLMNTDADQTVDSETASANPFDMGSLRNQIIAESLQFDEQEEISVPPSSEGSSSDCSGFLDPDEVSLDSIAASHFQYYRGTQRIKLLHKDVTLQLCCSVKVRFGADRGKYVDFSGRPKLSFVANAPPALCQVLDACDAAAQKFSVESGSSSEWKSVVIRKEGFVNFPTVRLHIPTIYEDNCPRYETEIYKKGCSGSLEKLVFRDSDEASEIEALISSGISLEAYFSLDHYDYQQNAGIRLVAKKLVTL